MNERVRAQAGTRDAVKVVLTGAEMSALCWAAEMASAVSECRRLAKTTAAIESALLKLRSALH
jgi:hypothetical protein